MTKRISLLLIFLLFPAYLWAQTAALLPMAVQQFFDNNGNPLSAGTVTTYIVGTSTLKTTWRDAAETIANTNPIILDAGGKAIIYGDGIYRQLVKDRLGNTIWDAVTSAVGGGGATILGDGAAVGTIHPWSGITAPTRYVFAFGQELSRSTYSNLYTAITISTSLNCTNGSTILSGVIDTTQIPIGAAVEASCIPAGSTVASKTANTVTLNNMANVTVATTGRFFIYGNGNGTTTFNVPDLRGRAIAGRDNMGGTAASRLTSTYFAFPGTGANGGSQSQTLIGANLPAYTPTGTIVSTQASHSHFVANGDVGGGTGISGSNTMTASANLAGDNSYVLGGSATGASAGITSSSTPAITSTFTGAAQGGVSTAFSNVQPTITLNYIIKVLPDTPFSTTNVVTSIESMVGDLTCTIPIVCNSQAIGIGTTLTSGSVLFAASDGSITQDNSNLFWDNTNKRLGIKTVTPATSFQLHNATDKNFNLNYDGTDPTLFFSNDAANTYIKGYIDGAPLILNQKSAGNIGLGTASPNAQLHTTGTVRFAGITGGAGCVQADVNGFLSTSGLTCGSGGGGGAVTSVGLSMPSIFSVSGSPVTTSGTFTVTANGTSGAIPYFNSGTTLASSAVLAAGQPVRGGGAATSPSTGQVSSIFIDNIQSGTGAVTRTAQSKLNDIVSVKDFGAIGNGIADDTTAMRAAHATGKMIYYPSGTYLFTNIGGIYSTFENGGIIGDGIAQTFLTTTTTNSTDVISYTGTGTELNSARFEHFYLATNARTGGIGLRIDPASGNLHYSTINDVKFRNFPTAIFFDNTVAFTINNSKILNYTNAGIWFQNTTSPDSGDHFITGNHINGDPGGIGILQKSGGGAKIIGNKIIGANSGAGYYLQLTGTTADLIISANSFESFTTGAIIFTQATLGAQLYSITINGNQINTGNANVSAIFTDASGVVGKMSITGNVIETRGTGNGIALNNVTQFVISGNQLTGEAGGIGIHHLASSNGLINGNMPVGFGTLVTPAAGTVYVSNNPT